MKKNMKTMDGNTAAAYVSYAFTEIASIYPITPSSPMAELVDEWSIEDKKNIFGQNVKVSEMQSESGAAGTMHGALQGGALATTYTASQGLLLMIPNIYKMAGELLPGVLHVSARALATHALSIFGDHQDVMACRQTGAALLCSSSVQEVMDIGGVAHLSSIKSRIPFIHFFDGFRTSHEYQKIELIDYDDYKRFIDKDAVKEFRERALNPQNPKVRGTAQNPDIYFQGREAANKFYEKVPDIVENYMMEINKITGRNNHIFNYYGASDAEYIIIAMGSVCDTIEEVVDYLLKKGERVGMIKVHLYRPFSKEYLQNIVPKTVKNIAVLDRTKEPGSTGEPLYLDVIDTFYSQSIKPIIVGGRYGLGSKDTRPSHILAVFENLKNKSIKNGFTIGINDDVTNTSINESKQNIPSKADTINCKFYGLGSDGTVGANKSAIKIIGDYTELYAQAYFSYDSKKSGGTTVSHLRFGKSPIKSPYLIFEGDYIACHNKSFIYQYDILKGLKKGGNFVLNCPWDENEIDQKLPDNIKKYIAENNINFYIIDAVKIAMEIGLGGRINMIMQAVFFKLSNVIPIEDAIKFLKESVEEAYGKKGEKIVEMNKHAIDKGINALIKVNVNDNWSRINIIENIEENIPSFIKNIQIPMTKQEGDELPVSKFIGMEDGTFPVGTTAYEKRGIAVLVPEWQENNCIQCNQCSYVCPHATIRPFLLDENEVKNADKDFITIQAKGASLEKYRYRIQISPLDCTGCGNCADICPAPNKAIIMKSAEEQILKQSKNFEFAIGLKEKKTGINTDTVKGSQFKKPLFEFNGACPGCGETPYVKLLTQLFGERMMIANATGCSSIYGASAPSVPYTINDEGRGPVWANSLFEDNAEYGYGMYIAVNKIRQRLFDLSKELFKFNIPSNLKGALEEWINCFDDGEASKAATKQVIDNLNLYKNNDFEYIIREIIEKKDYLIKRSHWMLGGDGWAYDIGFGGLDHVISTGDDINIFVMDTEVYSNTGGQSSKSTPTGAIAKFAAGGKRIRKKDLGLMAISYGYAYVAQISLGANMNQAIKAITEAEKYKGPSLIIAYSPCISHGIKLGMGNSIREEKKAVDSGYFHLYRYNPDLKKQGKNPFILDSKEPTGDFKEFLKGEIRYSSLMNILPNEADELYNIAENNMKERYEMYKRLSMQ